MIIAFWTKGGSIAETVEFVHCSHADIVKFDLAWQNDTIATRNYYGLRVIDKKWKM